MEKKIKAGILGMGNMGRGHGCNLLKMKDVSLVALCSEPIDYARRFAKEQELDAALYDDAYDMIEHAGLDVLYICLPPFAHTGQLEAAAKRGIHIFIEKPIAMNIERAESMMRAAEEYNIHTQVGYQMRFGGAVERFKKLLDDGTAGKPTLYTANYECNSLHSPWWKDVKKCGGQVYEQVIHLYDMALYLMGEPKEVNGYVANVCHTDIEGYTVEDTSAANILFKNGTIGSITGSNCAVKNQWNGRFRVVCEYMVADFEDQNHARFIYTKEDEARIETVEMDTNVSFEEDLYFISVVKGENPPFATIKDGYKGVRLVSGVVESSGNNGKTVAV